MTDGVACPRCDHQLVPTDPTDDGNGAFFACASCRRRWNMNENGYLVERWLGPLSLCLYGVIFDAEPISRAEGVAHEIAEHRDHTELLWFATEIELEVAEPCQSVSQILAPMQASEEDLRAFLAGVALELRRIAG